ncbi:CidA/LrgA family protein [Spiribacter pallidus]|jgi:holin-like protein|uniref:CidA/LrgA family protein n=1 Tax=Spiribacter pallidus TaxID=1987936 RepID=A0ABV3TDB0_9GAMM
MAGLIAIVLALQLAGEVVVRLTGLPVPGPVLGMLTLFIVLVIRGRAPAGLEGLANALLGHLGLLFVPAGVGVVAYLGLIADRWLALITTLIASTLVAILVTALTLRLLLKRRGEHG